MSEPPPEDVPSLGTSFRPPLPVDLNRTLWPLQHGTGDRTIRRDDEGTWWRATRTPDGPATTRFVQRGDLIEVRAWGPGAARALAGAPDVVGASDSLDGFDPASGPVRDQHHRLPGLRIVRTAAVFEALVPIVLEQKVASSQARDSYRALLRKLAEPAPGPMPLVLPPSPEAVAGLRSWDFHRMGVEMRRAALLVEVARVASRLERAADLPPSEGRRLLMSVPGIGPWTAARVGLVALGDPDAVVVGDYHIPHAVCWIMAGEPRGSDERMLELLEPFPGHRGRALRLILSTGIHAPRFAPRRPLLRIDRI